MEKNTIFTKQPIKSDSYETIRWPYFLSLPFMWFITISVMVKKKLYKALNMPNPEINNFFFDGLGLACRKVKEYAKTWKAMDLIYNHTFPKKLLLGGALDEFYWHGLNCQALRNRYKLVKKELRNAISKFETGQEVRIASLACGSAQCLIEIVTEYKAKDITIRAILIDIAPEALEAAKNLAAKYSVSDQVETHQINLSNTNENEIVLDKFKPQIIEMLGFLDYVDQVEAISFVKKLYGCLPEDGILITCNIAPNMERYFLKWVINWPMVYRRENILKEIAEKSGFREYKVIYEPLKIHGILIAKR